MVSDAVLDGWADRRAVGGLTCRHATLLTLGAVVVSFPSVPSSVPPSWPCVLIGLWKDIYVS